MRHETRDMRHEILDFRIKNWGARHVYFGILGVFFLLFLLSCGDKKTHKAENKLKGPNTHAIIFLDKTQSVDVSNAFVAQKYQQAITSLIDENINKTGDRLEIYYIHENTSKARCLSLISRTEYENTDGMNATDLEAAETNYKLSIAKERGIFTKQALNRLMTTNNGASNKETNISASIPIIAQAGESGDVVKVYFLSDMVESIKAGRDFHIHPPKDAAEAENWAKADAEKLQNYSLTSPDITMILPFEPTSSSKENNPNVTSYWKILFETLGAGSINEI